jgi:hypothetical protein
VFICDKCTSSGKVHNCSLHYFYHSDVLGSLSKRPLGEVRKVRDDNIKVDVT